MEIIAIFAQNLFAVKYEGEESDELARLMDLWTDIEYLELFFEENKDDLQFFSLSVENAIRETQRQAQEMEEDIRQGNFSFQPLNDLEYKQVTLSMQKSKRRWLRLYAIKLDSDCYLITGGAIKLHHKMQDRPHTEQELTKLTICSDFLKNNGIFSNDSFIDFLET